jgi:predicted nuclease of predicted toxin-antitoxin system
MRFLADMGISPHTVRFLRQSGHDAVHLHDLAFDRLDDASVLAWARQQARTLLTHDLDFGELMAVSASALPSVVTLRLQDMRPDNVNRHLEAILAHHAGELEMGVMMTVTERHVRIRRLPI